MRKTFFLVLSLFAIQHLSAQWSIGLSGGYAYNQYIYDPQYMYGMHYSGHHGFAAEIPVTYHFNEWLALKTGLSFVQKGYTLNGSNATSEFCELQREDYYLSAPVCAEFSFGGDKLRGFVDLGGYVGGWLKSLFRLEYIDLVGNSNEGFYYPYRDFRKDVDLRVESGLIGGIGLKWMPKNFLTTFVSTQCYYALTTQQKDYQLKKFPSRNMTYLVQVGIMYNFKSKRK